MNVTPIKPEAQDDLRIPDPPPQESTRVSVPDIDTPPLPPEAERRMIAVASANRWHFRARTGAQHFLATPALAWLWLVSALTGREAVVNLGVNGAEQFLRNRHERRHLHLVSLENVILEIDENLSHVPRQTVELVFPDGTRRRDESYVVDSDIVNAISDIAGSVRRKHGLVKADDHGEPHCGAARFTDVPVPTKTPNERTTRYHG